MKVSNPYLSGETPLWSTSEYDALGRVTRVTVPDGSATATSYAGNTATVTDPAGKRKKFTYDAFGSLAQVAEPDSQGNLTVPTNYSYDAADRLLTVSMNGGAQTRTFVYNSYGQVTSATNPENGTASYSYDDHLLASKTDAKNQVTNYEYDSYKRLTRMAPPNCTDCIEQKRFIYDSYPADPGEHAYGRLAAIEWSQPSLQIGQYLHAYDYTHVFGYWTNGTVMRSKLTQKDTYNGQTVSRSLEADFAWTVQGAVSKVTCPSGRLLFYNFDTGGRLDGLQQLEAGGFPDADLVTAASYNKAGQPLTTDFLDSATVRETRSYDPNTLQLTGIQVPGALDLSYVYPAAPANDGRISTETNNLTNTTVSYGYDQLNRLSTATSVTGSTTNWGLSFSYDVYGNRTAQAVTAGTAPAFSAAFGNNNHMVGYSYDNNGNQLNTPDGATLTYDWDNRMTNWSSSGASETYHYHPAGWRTWKKKSTEAEGTLYLYGPGGQLLHERSDSGNTAADYMYFGGRLLYTARYQSGTWTQTAMYTDRLGTVRNGGKSYYPFGEEVGSTANNTYKFASTYRDSTTGLDYAVNRYYASGTARFTTPDPYKASAGASDPQSWNRYSYTQGDPVNYKDPTGLLMAPWDDDWWFGGGGGGGGWGGYPCGPDWMWDASLVGPCDAFYSLPLLPIVASPRPPEPRKPRPAYLKVEYPDDDCYRPNAGAPGVWTREIKYTLYGDNDQKFDYMQHAVISEHLTLTWGQKKPKESSDDSGDTFTDTISVGNGGPFDVRQTFTVSVWGQTFNVSIIDRLGRQRGENFIKARGDSVAIDNDKNMPKGKHPPCKTQI
jgi:RHS repeat-associated protein